MKISLFKCLVVIVVLIGALQSPFVGADSRRWHDQRHGHRHGHHHGLSDSFYLGLGFAFPIYLYGYSYYPFPPIYVRPVQPPSPADTADQPAYSSRQDEPAYCREYTKKIIIAEKEETVYGTACLQEDGSWRIIN